MNQLPPIKEVNFVRLAVETLGGVTETAKLLVADRSTVHRWIKQQRISDLMCAREMASLLSLQIEVLMP